MFDLFRPEQLNTNGMRHHSEWSMWHWCNAAANQKLGPRYVSVCRGNAFRNALKFGLRPEFAQEFANQ